MPWCGRSAHQADPPDLALKGPEAGANFQIPGLQDVGTDQSFIDPVRHPHSVELRQTPPGIDQKLQTCGLQTRDQGLMRAGMTNG